MNNPQNANDTSAFWASRWSAAAWLWCYCSPRLRATANVVPVLEAAATISRQTDRGLLGAVVDLSEADLDDVIDELEDALVLEPWGSDGWRFRHELLREVAAELAPPSVARSLHATVADALVGGGRGSGLAAGRRPLPAGRAARLRQLAVGGGQLAGLRRTWCAVGSHRHHDHAVRHLANGRAERIYPLVRRHPRAGVDRSRATRAGPPPLSR
jgi:hypothetical protein